MADGSTSVKRAPAWATHGALLVVQIAFGSQAVEGKVAMMTRDTGGEAIPAFALAMTRMLGGAIAFQLILALVSRRAKREGAPLPRPTARDQLHLVVLSVLGVAANQALFLTGLRLTTPFAVSLLGASIPVMTAVLAVLVGQERGTLRTFAGLALAVSGVLMLIGIGRVDKGAILVAINSVAYSAYLVFSRGIIRRLGALVVITWVFTWGAMLFAPLGMLTLVRAAPEFTPRGYMYIAYIVAMPTVIAYLFNAWALGRSSATLVTVYIYLQPLITATIAWVQLGHAVSARTLGAGVLILFGVAVVASRRNVMPPKVPATEASGQ